MASKLDNFKWKNNTNGFDKNKGNIVPWRPKKGIALCNEQLKEAWYEPATKQDIETNYMSILNLEESKLKEMVNDTTQPMLIRILIKNMLSWKWFDIVEKMLDRWIWKAVQKDEVKLEVIENWSDILKKIQNWEISRSEAYSVMQKVKEL